MAARGARAAERAHAAGRRVMNRRISREMCGSAMHPRSKVGRSHKLMPKSDPKDLCPPAKYKPRRGARALSAAEIKAAADRAEARLEAHRSIFGDEAKDEGVTITRPTWLRLCSRSSSTRRATGRSACPGHAHHHDGKEPPDAVRSSAGVPRRSRKVVAFRDVEAFVKRRRRCPGACARRRGYVQGARARQRARCTDRNIGRR